MSYAPPPNPPYMPPTPQPTNSAARLLFIFSGCGCLVVVGVMIISGLLIAQLVETIQNTSNEEFTVAIGWANDEEVVEVRHSGFFGNLFNESGFIVYGDFEQVRLTNVNSGTQRNVAFDGASIQYVTRVSNGPLTCIAPDAIYHDCLTDDRRALTGRSTSSRGQWDIGGNFFLYHDEQRIYIHDGDTIEIVNFQPDGATNTYIVAAAWNPIGTQYAVLFANGQITVFDVDADGTATNTFTLNDTTTPTTTEGFNLFESWVYWLDINTILTVTNTIIATWDVDTGTRLASINRSDRAVSSNLLPAGGLVMAQSNLIVTLDDDLQVINANTIRTDLARIDLIETNPSGTRVAVLGARSINGDISVYVYDLLTRTLIYEGD